VSGVFQYADKQIGRFYQKLLGTDFFDNGILFIVGDHRAMLPVHQHEIETFGAFKPQAKVPLVISFGDKVSFAEERSFQQIDIYNSIKNSISRELCTSDWVGNLLGAHQVPAKYIFHRRGDNRDLVSVFFGQRDVLIKLDGDKTKIVNPEGLDESISDEILGKINTDRIFRSMHYSKNG
jgi:lipoteichoic acid synthase